LRPGPPASPLSPSFGRKDTCRKCRRELLPDPPPITKLRVWVCTIVLAFLSRGTGARPGEVRGTPRAQTESPGPRARLPAWEAQDAGFP
jgi:hypothetical protein